LLTEFSPFRNAFAANPNGENRIIEQGDIFFYRPRVGTYAVDELGIELDTDRAAVENADLFRQLRLRPGELPTEPLEMGRLV